MALAGTVVRRLGEFSSQELANMAKTFAKTARAMGTIVYQQELANTTWAVAKAAQLDEALIVALASAAELHLGAFCP